MILVESGRRDERGFDAKLIFAAQLAARGHAVVLDDAALPERFERSQKYEAAPFLSRVEDAALSAILLIGAEDIADDTLARLWMLAGGEAVRVVAIGRFATHQAEIGARTKLAYTLGREPEVVNTTDVFSEDIPVVGVSPLAATPPVRPAPLRAAPEVFVFVTPELLEEPATLPVLAALDHAPGFRLTIVTPGAGKDRIRKSRYSGLNVLGYSEVGPSVLAQRADLAAFFGADAPGERMAAFAVDLLASGKVVIDCTVTRAFAASGAPVVRGPEEIAALHNFLEFAVLKNREAIGREARSSAWITARDISLLEGAVGLTPGTSHTSATDGRIVFVPTNGNGLGHAQRCSLIAAELPDRGHVAFAAFPSCVPLVKGRGFACLPLVQKSADHPEDFSNDILNYLRLRRTLSARDHLVFDGGYVFDSIFRVVQEAGCSATWIRRGLWRPGQVASAQIDREPVFGQVIVPGEAFEELNADYSVGAHVHRVGPIVQRSPETDPAEVRARLSRMLGFEFDTLVVTMLGGGVAADRSAQLQRICGLLASRPRCLHLVVVWPNAMIAPGLHGWKNTRVVRTHNSLALCAAADFVVSAVGYNSFHELLYHAIPAILVPQVAPFMDDQERRARAASDRDLAVTVLAHELLGLERAVSDMLEGQAGSLRARIEKVELPTTGNGAAAKYIEQEAAR